MPAPLALDPQTAYQAMIESYNAGRWWAAASLACSLHTWAEANPQEARWMKRKHLANVVVIERAARRNLDRQRSGANG